MYKKNKGMGSLYLPVAGFDEDGQENLAYNRFSNKLLTKFDLSKIFQYLQQLNPTYKIKLTISEPTHKNVTQKGLRTLTLSVNGVSVPIGKVVNCEDKGIISALNDYDVALYMDMSTGSDMLDDMEKEGKCPSLAEVKQLLDEKTKEAKKKQSEEITPVLRLIDSDPESITYVPSMGVVLPDDLRTHEVPLDETAIPVLPKKDREAAAKALKDKKRADERESRKGKNLDLMRLRKQVEEDKLKEQKKREAIRKSVEADQKRVRSEQRARMEERKRKREENGEESELQKRRKGNNEETIKARDKELEERYKEYIARKDNRTSLKSAISSRTGHERKKKQLKHIQREYLGLANNRDSQFVKDVEEMVSTLQKLIKDYEEPGSTAETPTVATVTTTPKKKKSKKETKAENEYNEIILYDYFDDPIGDMDDVLTLETIAHSLTNDVIRHLPTDSSVRKQAEKKLAQIEKRIKDFKDRERGAMEISTTEKRPIDVYNEILESDILEDEIDDDGEAKEIEDIVERLERDVIEKIPPGTNERLRKEAERTNAKLKRNLQKYYTKNPGARPKPTPKKTPSSTPKKKTPSSSTSKKSSPPSSTPKLPSSSSSTPPIPSSSSSTPKKSSPPSSTPPKKPPSSSIPPKKPPSSSTPKKTPSPKKPDTPANIIKKKLINVKALERFETRESELERAINTVNDLQEYRELLDDVRQFFLMNLNPPSERTLIEKRALSLERKLANAINDYSVRTQEHVPIHFDSPEPGSVEDLRRAAEFAATLDGMSAEETFNHLGALSGGGRGRGRGRGGRGNGRGGRGNGQTSSTTNPDLVQTTTTSSAPSTSGAPRRSRAKQRTGTGRMSKTRWDPEGPPPGDDSSDSDEGKDRRHRPSIPKGRGPYTQGTLVKGRPNPREDRGHLAQGDRPNQSKKWHRQGGHADEVAGSERYANDHKYRGEDETFEKNLPLRKKDMFNFLKTADYERAAKVIDDILLFKKRIPRGQITRNSNSGIQDDQTRNQLRDMYRDYDRWRDKAMEFKNRVDRVKWRNYRYERNDKLKKQKGWKQNKSTSKSIWTDAIEQWNNLPDSTVAGSNTIKKAWCVPVAGTEAYRRVMDIFEQIKSGQWDGERKRVLVKRKRPLPLPDKNS